MMTNNASADFSRIITLLRKERGLSQKKAATDLGISQALLSHYEKGIRECGLEFLVKTADYYGVSCDYLLGRSPEPQGQIISFDELEEPDTNQKERISSPSPQSMIAIFNRKLITNSVTILYNLMARCGSDTIMREISSFLMLAVYRMFRIVHNCNHKNDQNFFTVPKVVAQSSAAAAMQLCEGNAAAAAEGIKLPQQDTASVDSPIISAALLAEESPNLSTSLLNLVKNSETRIQLISQSILGK